MPYRTLVNNHVFFQHPDLVRILGIHENVIAIMMNSIARASQDESGETASGEGQGLEEDTSHEMVSQLSGTHTVCFIRDYMQNLTLSHFLHEERPATDKRTHHNIPKFIH